MSDSQSPPSPHSISPPPPEPIKISDYELLRCIGAGNYGEVWLARNIMGTYRAIKIVDRKRFPVLGPFNREFNGIKKYEPLSRSHPGLVAILHIGQNETAGYFYYVMEIGDDEHSVQKFEVDAYFPKTLATELARLGRLSAVECIRIGLSLSSALTHLHQNGLVHRDIKPSNIIFVNGTPKLADIGLVADISESATFVGTEGYVPPEGPGKPTADLYALGKVLYQISMGRKLHDFPELPTNFDQQADAPRLRALYQAILCACDLNPRKRFQSGAEMHAQLARISPEAASRPSLESSLPLGDTPPLNIAILHQTNQPADDRLMNLIRDRFAKQHSSIFVNPQSALGVAWAREIETRISQADVIIALLSPAALDSEMLAYELELAYEMAQQHDGKPRVAAVRLQSAYGSLGPLARSLEGRPVFDWHSQKDDDPLLAHINRFLHSEQATALNQTVHPLEATGGAVPLSSKFYIARPVDHEFQSAIDRSDSIVLIKGARQMGKTSLLARGIDQARREGCKVVSTDLQSFDATSLKSLPGFYLSLSQSLAEQLDLPVFPEDVWNERRSPNRNFEGYIQTHVLPHIKSSLIWGLDEVDRLFTCSFSTEAFSLFRSWHNKRALEPDAPWSKLTLVIAYATEAHLFITDLNQSPFNVGTRLALEDFSPGQVAELNHLHGQPLKNQSEINRLMELLNGQPYLVRRALNELVSKKLSLAELETEIQREEGIFSDHLRRLVLTLAKDPLNLDVARSLLAGQPSCSSESFYRLRSAGVITGDSPQQIRFRCQLYETYLRRHLT